MPRTRAYRRAQARKVKARALRVIRDWQGDWTDEEYEALIGDRKAFAAKMAARGFTSRVRWFGRGPRPSHARRIAAADAQLDDHNTPPEPTGGYWVVSVRGREWVTWEETECNCEVCDPATAARHQREYEIDRAYQQRDDQLHADQGFEKEWFEEDYYWSDFRWVMPNNPHNDERDIMDFALGIPDHAKWADVDDSVDEATQIIAEAA